MFNQVVPSVAVLGAATFSCLATAALAQPAGAVDYSLPAQELERSVREVAVRSDTSAGGLKRLTAGGPRPRLEMTMEREDFDTELTELGTASADTEGAMGETVEAVGLWHKTGISDE